MQFNGCRCRRSHKDRQRDEDLAIEEKRALLPRRYACSLPIMPVGGEINTRKEKWL